MCLMCGGWWVVAAVLRIEVELAKAHEELEIVRDKGSRFDELMR